MSDHEFEIYLGLLGRMLRLSQGQRVAVADELRDHLESRLEEMTESGMGREEAIRIALEEFGDAAGLAHEFTRIARTRFRRRIMRYSLTSAAAVVVLGLIVTALLPDGSTGGAAPSTLAQAGLGGVGPAGAGDAPAADPAASEPDVMSFLDVSAVSDPAAELNAATRAALSKRIPIDFADVPLGEVVRFLSEAASTDILVDWPRVEDRYGVSRDEPVTLALRDVSIGTALDLVLEGVGLPPSSFIPRDGIVIVSDADRLSAYSEVRMYNVRDILSVGPDAWVAGVVDPLGGGGVTGMGGMPGMMGGAGNDYGMAGNPAAGGGYSAGFGAAGGAGAGDGYGAGRYAAGAPGGPMAGGFAGGADGAIAGAGAGDHTMLLSHRAEELMEAIHTTVDRTTWMNSGGTGSIIHLNGILIVSHTPVTHDRIERFLAQYRSALGSRQGQVIHTP